MQFIIPILTILFVGLKVTEQIAWSWWWVFSPIWIGIPIILVLLAISLTGLLALASWAEKK